MTPQDKALVRETFAMVEPIADQAAALFYNQLFTLAPQYRALFTHDIEDQGKKLMQTLGVAVAHLDNLDAIIPTIQKLGQRHAGYGVQPEDYAVVGEALLWTLEQGLGDVFTPEVEQAWRTVYTALANVMKEAAYSDALLPN